MDLLKYLEPMKNLPEKVFESCVLAWGKKIDG